MTSEDKLIERLRKIEALFGGATTSGERDAAGAALQRIRDRLRAMEREDPPVEYSFSLPDPWKRRLFLALARRYGLKPFRYPRQRYSTVMIRVPVTFVDNTLWPEYERLAHELGAWLDEATARVIRESLGADGGEAVERPAPRLLG